MGDGSPPSGADRPAEAHRRTPAIRDMVRETDLAPAHLVLPLFVHRGPDEPIDSMPGVNRWSVDGLLGEVGRAADLGFGLWCCSKPPPTS